MTADEIKKFCLDTFRHEYFEVGNDEKGAMLVVVAAVLGRLSQWAREWETGLAESVQRQAFVDGTAYCDGKRITFKYVADQLDALRSVLTEARTGHTDTPVAPAG